MKYPVHHGQGEGVFSIENSVMSNKDTQTIFFPIFFIIVIIIIFNRETKHEKLCHNFQRRFHADVSKGKLNYISSH